MSQLLFKITHQMINRVDTFKPVADSRNYLTAHFNFLTPEWDTPSRVAIFTKNDVSYQMLLDENNECLVPWELLTERGDIYVSCYCGNLITTNRSRVHISESGYSADGENTEPPTPNIYDQIYEQLMERFDEMEKDLYIIDGGNFTDWE